MPVQREWAGTQLCCEPKTTLQDKSMCQLRSETVSWASCPSKPNVVPTTAETPRVLGLRAGLGQSRWTGSSAALGKESYISTRISLSMKPKALRADGVPFTVQLPETGGIWELSSQRFGKGRQQWLSVGPGWLGLKQSHRWLLTMYGVLKCWHGLMSVLN